MPLYKLIKPFAENSSYCLPQFLTYDQKMLLPYCHLVVWPRYAPTALHVQYGQNTVKETSALVQGCKTPWAVRDAMLPWVMSRLSVPVCSLHPAMRSFSLSAGGPNS